MSECNIVPLDILAVIKLHGVVELPCEDTTFINKKTLLLIFYLTCAAVYAGATTGKIILGENNGWSR